MYANDCLLIPISDSENNVVIRLFGATAGQNSVCVQVHGFLPYFYVLLESSFDEENIEYAKRYLNDIIKVSHLNMKKFSSFSRS